MGKSTFAYSPAQGSNAIDVNGEHITVRVTAASEGGKANAAVIALLDRRVVCDMLGFGEEVYEGVRLLAAKRCAEPSVQGEAASASTLITWQNARSPLG